MKVYILGFVLAAVVFVECGHTFIGTNVMRPLLLHKDVRYTSKMFQKRIEYLNYTIPANVRRSFTPRRIEGILAYDLTQSGASANVTSGGVGHDFVVLRMKSDRGHELHYDVYIY